jgi:hypothetical protein
MKKLDYILILSMVASYVSLLQISSEWLWINMATMHEILCGNCVGAN